MNSGISTFLGNSVVHHDTALSREEERLLFVVREPFASRQSGATLVAGWIEPNRPLRVESRMPMGGVIFSDGVEADFLNFNSGSEATILIAPDKALLVTGVP